MPGKGKYTTYYDDWAGGEKKARLEQVFTTSPFIGDDPYIKESVLTRVNEALRSDIAPGVNPLFENGVKIGWGDAPDLEQVTHTESGEPLASPYFPDVRSPGLAPGADTADTSVVAVNFEPRLGGDYVDLGEIEPNYTVPTSPRDNYSTTLSPATTAPGIHDAADPSKTAVKGVSDPAKE